MPADQPTGGIRARRVAKRERRETQRDFLSLTKTSLSYIPALRSLVPSELDALFDLTEGEDPAAPAESLRRAARFLWRERHLRSVGGNGEAEALLILAVVLARDKPRRDGHRLAHGSHRDRALSAWWWSATLNKRPRVVDRHRIDAKASELGDWLRGGVRAGSDPQELVRASERVSHETKGFRAVRYGSNNAVSRLVFSLLLRADPLDFVTGERIDGILLVEAARRTRHRRDAEQIELHHVFPQGFLASRSVAADRQNLIANIAPLSGATNGWISDRSPSQYVGEMVQCFGPEHVDRILRSHLLDRELLMQQFGFDEQIDSRQLAISEGLRRLLDPRALTVL
jgi:hypothetical protein